MNELGKLTAKQEKFCEEYLIDLNATQAAIRAGYSKKTAYSIGFENLKKPEIQEYLQAQREKIISSTGLTPEMVVTELAKVGFANIQDYIGEENSIRDISEIDREKTGAIESIHITVNVTKNKDGSREYERKSKRLKMHNKISALENLGKHLGIFEKNQGQFGLNKETLNTITSIMDRIDGKSRGLPDQSEIEDIESF